MASNEKIKVLIAEMDEHFLYLPLYFAVSNAVRLGFIPDRYDLHFQIAPGMTDKSALEQLLDTKSDENRNVWFSVGDPTPLMLGADWITTSAAIVGAMITSAAFWVVDHKSGKVLVFDDLAQFDKIYAYKKGTTSYAIAQAIVQRAKGRTVKIQPVGKKEELVALTNDVPGHAIALSPEILDIEKICKARTNIGIELRLADLPAYSNVLVTALVTRQDIVSDHPELVSGLLKALQRALVLAHKNDAELMSFAASRFLIRGDEPLVRQALKSAQECNVYPKSVEIGEAIWTNAVRHAYTAEGRAFDVNAEKITKAAYEKLIQPFAGIAKKAYTEVVVSRTPGDGPESRAGKKFKTAGRYVAAGIALASLGGIVFLAVLAQVIGESTILALSLGIGLVLAVAVDQVLETKSSWGPITRIFYWITVLILAVWLGLGLCEKCRDVAELTKGQVDLFGQWGVTAWVFVGAGIKYLRKLIRKGKLGP